MKVQLTQCKLGYGGTKGEMERLILDAENLSDTFEAARDENGDLAMSYADVVDAIHIVQTEMGITGTTAKEASETISGSWSATKAAWQNLLIAFGNGEDVKEAIGNLTATATMTVKNIIPVVKQALAGIADFVKEAGPIIIQELPGLIQDLLPGLLSAAVSLVGALIKALPGILSALWSTIKALFSTFMDWLRGQSPELADVFDGVIDAGKKVIAFFKDFRKNTEKIWKSVQKLFADTWESIKKTTSDKWNSIKSFLSKTWSNIKSSATTTWNALKKDATTSWTAIKSAITSQVDAAKSALSTAWNAIKTTATTTWNAIKTAATTTWNAIKTAISTAVNNAKTAVTNTFDNVKSWLSTTWTNIQSTASTMWDNIKTAITTPIETAKNTLSTTVENIKSALSSAWDNVTSTAASAWDGIKSAITAPIEEAKETISGIWDDIVGWFSGDIKLNFKLPKISLGEKVWETAFGDIKIPWPQITWNKKALDDPWMFSGATLFGAGEAGDEILYGRNSLMKDIGEAVKSGGGTRTTINITVNAAPGMDENMIADKVARKLQQQLNRRQAVWA